LLGTTSVFYLFR